MMTNHDASQVRTDVRIRALEMDDWIETKSGPRDEPRWDLVVGQKRYVRCEWVKRRICNAESMFLLLFSFSITKSLLE